MARSGSRGGCLGCVAVLAMLAAFVVAAFMWLAPPALRNVANAYRHRALEIVGAEEPVERRVDRDALGYAGERLPEGQQNVYLQLYEGVVALEESFAVFEAAPEDIDPAMKALMRDHPELFWLDGSCTYTYASMGDVVTVEPGLSVSLDRVPAVQAQVEGVANAFWASLPADADEYAKARAAYEYVIANTDYVIGAEQSQNIQSVLLNHASVCAGYARAYQYLLHRAGMFCAYVEGSVTTTGEDHAWDLVRIGDAYAYVDPTWGDPAYLGEAEQAPPTDIIYDYLCLTTDEIVRDHHVFAHPEEWPPCAAPELDFYGREGLLFGAYDEAALSEAFWRQVQAGAPLLAFKFSDDAALSEARDALAAGTFLRDDLLGIAQSSGQGSLRYGYLVSDTLRVVKLYW